jgi:hypothetical protein
MRFLLLVIAVLALGLGADPAGADSVRMPALENPYCSVPTYALPSIPEQARAFIDPMGRPAIAIGANLFEKQANEAYVRFLMAHECCHHSKGHFSKLHEQLAALGTRSFASVALAVKSMELDADCCAAKLLREKKDHTSLEAAKKSMSSFGGMPTGAYYPSGLERAFIISKCASE